MGVDLHACPLCPRVGVTWQHVYVILGVWTVFDGGGVGMIVLCALSIRLSLLADEQD